MNKILKSFLILCCFIFPLVSYSATFVTKTGNFKINILNDPNYDDEGNVLPGRNEVDLYKIEITSGTNTKDISIIRPFYLKTNDFTLEISGENALIKEGTYELTVRTVNVEDSVAYSLTPAVVHKIIVDFPDPTPTEVPTQEPTSTPTATATDTETATPTATDTETAVPTATPTETLIPNPAVLYEENFSFEDINETDMNATSKKKPAVNKNKYYPVHKKNK